MKRFLTIALIVAALVLPAAVKAAGINITVPNSGTEWDHGDTEYICWTWDDGGYGDPDSFCVYWTPYGNLQNPTWLLIATIDGNLAWPTMSYAWVVGDWTGGSFPPAGYPLYSAKVMVTAFYEHGIFYDISDAFKIN